MIVNSLCIFQNLNNLLWLDIEDDLMNCMVVYLSNFFIMDHPTSMFTFRDFVDNDHVLSLNSYCASNLLKPSNSERCPLYTYQLGRVSPFQVNCHRRSQLKWSTTNIHVWVFIAWELKFSMMGTIIRATENTVLTHQTLENSTRKTHDNPHFFVKGLSFTFNYVQSSLFNKSIM